MRRPCLVAPAGCEVVREEGQGARQGCQGGRGRFLVYVGAQPKGHPRPPSRLVAALHGVGRGTPVPDGGQSLPPQPHIGDLEGKPTAGSP